MSDLQGIIICLEQQWPQNEQKGYYYWEFFFHLNSVSYFFRSCYQHTPLSKLRIGTIHELKCIHQLPTSLRNLIYRSIISTSVMLTWKLYDILIQINNDSSINISVQKDRIDTVSADSNYVLCRCTTKCFASLTPYRWKWKWDLKSSKAEGI